MPDATGTAVDEYRTDRRRKWICHRESLESVVADKLRCGVSGEFAFRPRLDNTGSKQRVFYIMPASRARMRMRAFLCDRCRLHQPAIDVPIDLAIRVNNLLGIILRDDGDRLFFALRTFEAEMETRPRWRACCLLTHGSHWLYRKSSPRFFANCLRGLLSDRTRRLFRHRLRRLFGGGLRRLLFERVCRLFRCCGRSFFCARFHGFFCFSLRPLVCDLLKCVLLFFCVVA